VPRVPTFLILLAVLLSSAGARADDAAVPLVLDYTAPAGCPDSEQFLHQIAARTALARPALPNERAMKLTVVIKEVTGGDRGSLELESVDGATSARRVSAANCEQVVSALALMTALAVDPNASTAPVAKKEAPPQKPPTVPSKESEKPRAGDFRPERRSGTHWRLQLGMGLEGLAGVAPKALLLARPSAELGSAGGSRWSSAFRLSAGFGPSAGQDSGGAFSLLTGRVEGCPRFDVAHALQISPCVAFDAGKLEVRGVGVAPTERVERPWLAAGAVGRLEWKVATVLVLELAGEMFLPLVRDRFFVNSDATVHRTPPVVGGGTVGLGVRFP
jgi:hypothetical protein